MSGVRVFGHRGAPAYRPENTLESFRLAFEQGAEAIECDIVPTKDSQLVLRHESDLRDTTDVLTKDEFAGKFHSYQLTLAEIQELRAKERVPDWRPGSAKFDGQFSIPTLTSLLGSDFVNGKALILEVKDAPIFLGLGIDIVSLFADCVEASGIEDRATVYIEAFEWQTMDALRSRLGTKFPLYYGMEEWDEEHAFDYDGVSLDFQLIRRMPEIVERAHQAGLPVWGFTARVEFAKNSVEEYFHHLIETGVDAIFADHPDLLRQYVEGLA
jgi:glycerophosphoryl diester phosphodiesterase